MAEEYVEMTGTGTATGVPDLATLRLGVSQRAEGVAEALAGCTRAAHAVMAALDGAGIEPADRQTTGLEVSPGYDHRRDRPAGYDCSQGLVVRIRRPERVGELVDACATAAGDTFRLDGLAWSISDTDQLRRRAREAAWDDAKDKAQQVATLAGLHLGPAVSVVEQAPSFPAMFARAASFHEQSGDDVMPVETGEGSVAVTLRVRWALLTV